MDALWQALSWLLVAAELVTSTPRMRADLAHLPVPQAVAVAPETVQVP